MRRLSTIILTILLIFLFTSRNEVQAEDLPEILKKEIGKGAYEDLNKRIISLNKWIEETKFIQRVRGDLAFRSEEDVVENIHFTNLDSKL